ncbi:MAG: ATP-binding cassette domain-containing protein [Ignavibacteriales bacterium]|nr:ATP-binding cassette domain-containing protein [Ignavibacteriales bacterium]
MTDHLIEARSLVKAYTLGKKPTPVLRNVSATIPRGKISVIVGASGAGKSTLLHILGGLDRPDSGEALVEGESLFAMSETALAKFRNARVGFVFQFHHLLPEFTALENAAIPAMIGGASSRKSFERSRKLLDEMGLSHRLDHKPAELSGGEQQRVAVARALVNDPPLILADEPTGNLDSQNSRALNDIFLDLNKRLGKTFLIVTHNADLMGLADEVYEIKDGMVTPK